MQRTEFASSLIPQQAGSSPVYGQAPGDADDAADGAGDAQKNGAAGGATNGAAQANDRAVPSTPPRLDHLRRTRSPCNDFGGADGDADGDGSIRADRGPDMSPGNSPNRSPSRRLVCSPPYAPRFEAGVARAVNRSLAPPPPQQRSTASSPPPSSQRFGGAGSPPPSDGIGMPGQSPSVPAMPGASFSNFPAGSPSATPQPQRQPSPVFGTGSGGGPGGGGLSPSPSSSSRAAPSPVRLPTGSVGFNAASPASARSRADATPGVSPSARRRTGAGLMGQSRSAGNSRIDPEQVPRPVGQAEPVREEGGKRYETTKYHVPPAATQVATILDRGSASCEFMRCTVNQVPAYPSTANTAHVPIAVICQPFAELTEFEEPIPVVDFGESGPMRCTRCKAYVNPHFTWHGQGREATCNFCTQRVEVPEDYFCGIDDKGRRQDHMERPELQRGSIDYVAPSDYSDVAPGMPTIAFVVEATYQSVQSGFFPQVFWTLRGLLNFMDDPVRIAIITFDHTLHFYSFYPGLAEARRITVTDIEEPFVPCSPSALCVDPLNRTFRGQVESLFRDLPCYFQEPAPANVQSAGGAALKVACDLLGCNGGGHVIMFQASLQNMGIGALRFRDDIRLSQKTEDGAALFQPQQPQFFDAVATDCLQRGVAVSVFLAPSVGVYIDVASLSTVPRRTGGEISYMPGYDPCVDGERLHYDISRIVVQRAVYSCVFKLRCSKGLTVESMIATWEPEVIDPSTFHVSRLSVDATCNFVLVHSERIEGQKYVYMQVACLHTDRTGRRLIRVHTMQLPVTSSLSNVFRYTEIDTVTNVVIKQAAAAALTGHGTFKDKLSKQCVDMLHAYRVNCASMTSAGQLILPESLKLLPLYVSSIRKMAAFRSGSDIRADDRLAALIRVLGLQMALTAPLVYPRIYTMLPLPERAGQRTEVGDNVHMPPTIACSSDKLAVDRIYLVDNGVNLKLYIREEVTTDQLLQTFGVASPAEVAEILARPEDEQVQELSDEAVRIIAIIWQIRRERTRVPWQPLAVVAVGSPEVAKVLATICEDRVAGEMNYVDFLCHIHKLVQNKQE